MTFKAIMENPAMLRSIFEVISFLVDEVPVKAGPDGIVLNAMDGSHVGMMSVRLKKDFFVDYSASGDTSIGVTVADIIKILRRGKPTDTIELSSTDDDKGLSIKMKNEKSKRTFKIKGKTVNDLEVDINKFMQNIESQFSFKFKILPALLEEFIKDAAIISEKIQIKGTDGKSINFSASDDTGEVEIELGTTGAEEKDGVWAVESNGDVSSIYSLAFMENFIKVQSVVKTIDVGFGNNLPIKLAGSLVSKNDDNEDGNGIITYFLAPRNEEEEEKEDDFEEGIGADFDDTSNEVTDDDEEE